MGIPEFAPWPAVWFKAGVLGLASLTAALGQSVTVDSGPVLTESVSNPLSGNSGTNCPLTAPAAASAFHAGDPIMTVWLGLLGLTSQDSVLLSFSYNGTSEPTLGWFYPAGSFQAGDNYLLCPSVGTASSLGSWAQAFAALFPNGGGVGSWTLGIYIDGSSSPISTVPFTVLGSITMDSGPVLTESAPNPTNTCPLTAPTASAFHAGDPIMTVWLQLLGLTPQDSVLFGFSYNGASEPTLGWFYPSGSFQSGKNYVFCPSVGTASSLGSFAQAFAALFPNGGGAGSWTLGIYLNGSALPVSTTPFAVLGASNTSAAITSVTTANAGPVIAQNTFIVIKGTDLVPASTPASGTIWSTAPSFASGLMPTTLGGVSVTVNNNPAFVYFYCSAATDPACSQDQLNILTPLDNTIGSVPVVVTSGDVSSPSFSVSMQAVAPSFLLFSPAGYIAATHLNSTLLGPTSLYPGSSTPAAAGETIVLYAVGFGLPAKALVNGSAIQSGPLAVLPVCQVGGTPATVIYAGLASAGLYQLNITIPPGAANGDNAVSCTYNGATTPVGDLITVQSSTPGATLTIAMSGTGSGAVSSSPPGTSCGSGCLSFAAGTVVTLTATPNTGSAFAGWSGACTGTGSCTVTMSSNEAVTAAFNLIATVNPTLTITTAGTGSGTVSASPAGTSCGSGCLSFASGTVVTLTAKPNTGSTFTGWSGACSGTGSCTVTMNSNLAVTATFNLTSNPGYTVGGTVTGLAGSGLVLSDNGGDDLPISASGSFVFKIALASGATYSVGVAAQPTSPGQTCVVTNGSGTIASSPANNVSVSCAEGTSSTPAILQGASWDLGGPRPISTVTWVNRNGVTTTSQAIAGEVEVVVNPTTTSAGSIGTLVTRNGGTLFAQLPAVGLYWARVIAGQEETFIAAVRPSVTDAFPNLALVADALNLATTFADAGNSSSPVTVTSGNLVVDDFSKPEPLTSTQPLVYALYSNGKVQFDASGNFISTTIAADGAPHGAIMDAIRTNHYTLTDPTLTSSPLAVNLAWSDIAAGLASEIAGSSAIGANPVINLSLGVNDCWQNCPSSGTQHQGPADSQADNAAYLEGLVSLLNSNLAGSRSTVIARAAGNDGTDLSEVETNLQAQTAPSTAWNQIIDVGALDGNNQIAYYSNYSSAPGTVIYVPVNYVANPANVAVQGTSFAAPQIQYLVDQIRLNRPDLTPAQLRQVLFGAASGSTATNPATGLPIKIQVIPAPFAKQTLTNALAVANTLFPQQVFTVTVIKAGTGSGDVTANPTGFSYPAGTLVTLTAIPDPLSSFAGWGSASGINCSQCKVGLVHDVQ